MGELVEDVDVWRHVQRSVPEAWATLEQDVDVREPKMKITLRLDESVARFYRAMGPGYHARINRVLATYAQMKIGDVKREAESLEDLMIRVTKSRWDEMKAQED